MFWKLNLKTEKDQICTYSHKSKLTTKQNLLVSILQKVNMSVLHQSNVLTVAILLLKQVR